VVYGITSHGPKTGCGEVGHPGIYAKVSVVTSWITDHTGKGTRFSGSTGTKKTGVTAPKRQHIFRVNRENPSFSTAREIPG